jgi:hypothetical protein
VRARVGDLVRTLGEFKSDKVFMGIVVKKQPGQIWVRWLDDGSVMWMPPRKLEVVSASR